MGTFFVFFGTLLLSQFVAVLAAISLAEYFRSDQEFIAVLFVVPLFAIVAIAVFAIVYKAARSARALQTTALVLFAIVLVLLALPSAIAAFTTKSVAALGIGAKDVPILLQLLVSTFIVVLTQWGLVRRRFLRRRGEHDLSRWPWVATVIAGLAVLNPPALNAIGAALAHSPVDWFRDPGTIGALALAAGVLVLIAIECYIRRRILRRRQAVIS